MRQDYDALHNLHCCHATNALPNDPAENYLRLTRDDNSLKLQVSKTMNLIDNFRNWRRYRETVNELSRLSNRELNDLGISRSDIPYVARKSSF